MIRFILGSVGCLLFLGETSPVHTASVQHSPAVTIDASGQVAQIRLSYLDATARTNFARVFEVPSYQEYQPFSLLISNSSGQAIVVLSIRWTVTSRGMSRYYDCSSDSLELSLPIGSSSSSARFSIAGPASARGMPVMIGESHHSSPGDAVLPAGERMLVAPGLMVTETMAVQRGSGSGMTSLPQEFKDADLISAAVDTVVLEDGLVLGPDASQTVDKLLMAKAALDAIGEAVRKAEQSGQDGLEVLRQLAGARPSPGEGPEKMRLAMLARRFMSSRDWRVQIENATRVQLPKFHR